MRPSQRPSSSSSSPSHQSLLARRSHLLPARSTPFPNAGHSFEGDNKKEKKKRGFGEEKKKSEKAFILINHATMIASPQHSRITTV
ncbi:hypothetical protein AAC387_Pa08g1082 [Persea americana]